MFSYGQVDFKIITQGRGASLYYPGDVPLVRTAIDMIIDDSKLVAEQPFQLTNELELGSILIGIPGQSQTFDDLLARYQVDISAFKGQWEAFQLQVVGRGEEQRLLVIGSDSHGAAYGVLELSRLIGVSPWVWWADASPERKSEIVLPGDYKVVQQPNVQYRGIFLNDEDWGLAPWSANTYEPNAMVKASIDQEKVQKMQTIGPKTYSEIFELLLRLRANTMWPAMHEVTIPFYFVEGNREASEKYGIYIGSSHCEPLARNSVTEWDIVGQGEYNYISNKKNVLAYWSDRLQELGPSNNIFTMGMRGKHDGAMEGVKGVEEYKTAIEQVIADQSKLLKKYIGSDPSQIPQVVIPYKEVLDVYRSGMKVPDYMTLMWCDDNYGYITHFPDEHEKQRSGGNGIYYHLSYWGRPHDYLWLSTMSPGLIHQQMRTAYERDVRKIWIANVGDIKPSEYQIELFLDMAWDIDKVNSLGIDQHLYNWLTNIFGAQVGDKMLPIMREHYRLAHIRKPEFMGNTREEEADRNYYRTVRDLPWSEETINERLKNYDVLVKQTAAMMDLIPQEQAAAFFELVAYPVQAAAAMNRKMLNAQLARHGKAEWRDSHTAFDEIVQLTNKYNNLNGGKWNLIMDYRPRKLPVFDKVKEEEATGPMLEPQEPLLTLNGADLKGDRQVVEGLGYAGKAISIAKGQEVYADFAPLKSDSVIIEVRLIPTHPVEDEQLRFAITLNDNPVQKIAYHTKGRSEEWKLNVFRNQAIRTARFAVSANEKSRIRFTALDEGVLLDEIKVYVESKN